MALDPGQAPFGKDQCAGGPGKDHIFFNSTLPALCDIEHIVLPARISSRTGWDMRYWRAMTGPDAAVIITSIVFALLGAAWGALVSIGIDRISAKEKRATVFRAIRGAAAMALPGAFAGAWAAYAFDLENALWFAGRVAVVAGGFALVGALLAGPLVALSALVEGSGFKEWRRDVAQMALGSSLLAAVPGVVLGLPLAFETYPVFRLDPSPSSREWIVASSAAVAGGLVGSIVTLATNRGEVLFTVLGCVLSAFVFGLCGGFAAALLSADGSFDRVVFFATAAVAGGLAVTPIAILVFALFGTLIGAACLAMYAAFPYIADVSTPEPSDFGEEQPRNPLALFASFARLARDEGPIAPLLAMFAVSSVLGVLGGLIGGPFLGVSILRSMGLG